MRPGGATATRSRKDKILTRLAYRIAALATAAMAASTPAPAQDQADNRGVLKATHGAWEVRCAKEGNACAIQHVGKLGDKDAMLINIRRVKDAKDQQGKEIPAVIEVITPLGVLIPYGVRVKIDDGQVSPIGLTRCAPAGCVASAPMSEQAVEQMKAGAKAVFAFFLAQETPIEVSLNGFTKAYGSIQPIVLQQPPR